MNEPRQVNRFWPYGDADIRYFNGNLFGGARAYELDPTSVFELFTAAQQDWRKVEPAIFGTLLEQVLEGTGERGKLGAHYTPRRYVQQLISATFGELLGTEWTAAEAGARAAADAGDTADAIAAVSAFHDRLATLVVLDPGVRHGQFPVCRDGGAAAPRKRGDPAGRGNGAHAAAARPPQPVPGARAQPARGGHR